MDAQVFQSWRGAWIMAAIIFVLDQLTKWIARDALGQSVGLVEVLPFFNFVLVYNRGVSFGLFGAGDSGLQAYVLAGAAVLVSGFLLAWARKQTDRVSVFALGAIVGGALGNALDRLYLPGVTDFLDFYWANWHWPAFNLADAAISIGVAVLLVCGLFPARARTIY